MEMSIREKVAASNSPRSFVYEPCIVYYYGVGSMYTDRADKDIRREGNTREEMGRGVRRRRLHAFRKCFVILALVWIHLE
jgi:hypothetical protein